jgi:hypothetical protein
MRPLKVTIAVGIWNLCLHCILDADEGNVQKAVGGSLALAIR